jgi:hypothetical protein
MSKSNQRKIDCYHESGHALQAWLEGIEIIELRLVPEHEAGELSAVTEMRIPGPTAQWTRHDLFGHMRVTLAGPVAEQLGPMPATAVERELAKHEDIQHSLKAVFYAQQFGAGRIPDDSVPIFVASARQDVIEAFKYACVTRCVKVLVRELLRRERIAGPDAEAFIASQITLEERTTIRRECCLTGAKERQTELPRIARDGKPPDCPESCEAVPYAIYVGNQPVALALRIGSGESKMLTKADFDQMLDHDWGRPS